MNKHVILSGSLIALSMALTAAPDASAATPTYWGTYQHDAQHTGKATVKGPSIPNIKWSYLASSQVFTDPNDPNNLWTEDAGFTAGAAEGPDGTIYAAGNDGRGYAFDPRNGAIKHIFDSVGVCCAPPVVDQAGNIYFSGNGLWAFNPDYSLKFYYPDGGNCCGAITVADDGTVIVGNGYLHAFDPTNLVFVDPAVAYPELTFDPAIVSKIVAPKWIYNASEAGWSAAVTTDGKTVITMGKTTLSAVDLNNITLGEDGKYYAGNKWGNPIAITNDLETMPVLDGNTIYMADDQRIIAVNLTTAAVRTVYSFPGNQAVNLALNGSTLFATTVPVTVNADGSRTLDADNSDTTLLAINPVAGSLTWSTLLAGAGESHTNPIFDSTGAVYVNTIQKAEGVDYMDNLYMFTSTGTPVWTYSKGTTQANDSRTPIIGQDGTLYTLIDGEIVAFGGTADLSATIIANPNPVNTNAILAFTTTVANAGPDKSTATSVKLTLPTAFTSATNFALPSNCVQNNSRVLTCAIGELAAGTSAPVVVTGVAPSKASTISATATVRSEVPDPIATNNSKTVSVPVVAPAACDLTVTAVGGPTAVTMGTTKYNFTATVKNNGTGSCAASTLGFFFSSNTTIDGGSPDYLIGPKAVGTLAAGASVSVTLNTAVAKGAAPAASYYIGAYADYLKVVAETNETNNTKATTAKTTVK
jgi:hypothetical protein